METTHVASSNLTSSNLASAAPPAPPAPSFDLLEPHFTAGRKALRQETVRRLAHASPRYAGLVTGSGSAALDEPLLHAWLTDTAPELALEQLLFGYLRPIDRPPRLAVRTSPSGAVHLPCLGALHTGLPSASLELRWTLGAPPTLWTADGFAVPAVFAPRQLVPDTTIELYTELPPLCARFLHRARSAEALEARQTAVACLPVLRRALSLLERVAPAQRRALERDCRGLLLVRDPQVLSLAAMDARGLAVLSVPPQPSELYFCEDLVHQVGHITFFAITAQPCFTIAASTPLSRLTVRHDDHRTLYAAFHGNYTIMRMVELFDACLTADAVRGALRHELHGRLALALARYRDGLISIDDHRLYTPMAWAAHRRMIEVYDEVYQRRAGELRGYALTDQPYAFDHRIFCIHNPYRGEDALDPGGAP